MAGPGYHTIEFEKEVKYLNENNSYILKPSKSFLHKKDKVNSVLIPIFLSKEYFKLNTENKNFLKYDIKLTNKFHEIKKIFNH